MSGRRSLEDLPSSGSGFQRPLLTYCLLSYAITWAVWLPNLLAYRGILDTQPSPFLHYGGALGPIVAAFLVERWSRGPRGVRVLFRGLTRYRIGATWWIAALSPLLLLPLTAIVLLVGWGTGLEWEGFGISSRVPGMGLISTWVFAIMTYGIGEETGWRGFLLPRLQSRYDALGATLILSLIWAGWHTPMFFYRKGYVGLGLPGIIGIVVSMALGAVVLTWLFNSTRGSILAVAVWHGTWNMIAMTDVYQGRPVAIMSTVILAFGLLLVFVAGPRDLSRRQRVTIPWPPSEEAT